MLKFIPERNTKKFIKKQLLRILEENGYRGSLAGLDQFTSDVYDVVIRDPNIWGDECVGLCYALEMAEKYVKAEFGE